MDKIYIDIATPYFKDSNVDEIYVTNDNQVFYKNAKNYLKDYQAKNKNIKFELVKRSDVKKQMTKTISKSTTVKEKEVKE